MQENFSTIPEATPTARLSLENEFKKLGWLGPADHPTEEELVTQALDRIKLDPNQHKEFITMLNGIPGLDLVVGKLSLPGRFLARFMCVIMCWTCNWAMGCALGFVNHPNITLLLCVIGL